jgi:aspartate kinase
VVFVDKKVEVLKIGGGILQNKECFERVVKIVKEKKESGKEIILVLSALYGITDNLIDGSKKALSGEEVISIIKEIETKHFEYLKGIQNEKIRKDTEFIIKDKISILEKFFYGIHYLKEMSPRSKDMIQSFGERLSPIVMEAYLKDAGIKTKFYDAEEAGILAEGEFEKARANMKETKQNLNKLKKTLKEKVLLLPGYYGLDKNDDIKTFGRGGTDYSAGFIANIFDAKLEIWKDVSGFMSADPKLVKEAKQIENLSYDEAEELGYLGAKILHPRTIEPLKEKGLEAEIKNIFEPEKKGTTICKEKEETSKIKSITFADVSIINIKSVAMTNSTGFASIIFSQLSNNGIPIDLISTSETAISVSVKPEDEERAIKALKEIEEEYSLKINSQKNLSLIGVVGEGLKNKVGIAGEIFSQIGKENINIELISQGASEINISFVIDKEKRIKALNAIHSLT